jgi:glycosyltransferase involved in cell wall biosynthesis
MKLKLVVGITAPLSVVLLKGQLNYFSKLGYKVYLLAPETLETIEFCSNENATLLPVPIEREINIISDFRSLLIIYRHLRKIKPDIINVGTPKMGLLGSIAAWFLRIPKRFYTCRGFRFEHEKGLKRSVLKKMDKLALNASHKVICISSSVEQLGINEGMFSEKDSIVFGNGSSNGLDLAFYNPDNHSQLICQNLKTKNGVNGKFIFGFVGRIVDRKGINELYDAFLQINHEYPNTHLLIVGKANLAQVSDKSLMNRLESDVNVTLTGYVNNVNDYMAMMDVFVLPAWWEGFGNTLIQAAAMGLPIISCDVTGCRDAVKHDFNGILIPPKNPPVLKEKMLEFMHDERKRDFFGENGKKWAMNFDSKTIWSEMKKLYESQ